MPPGKRIICQICRHYYVTWEPDHPHGCRAIGFKSKHMPSSVVRANSGSACLYFAPKARPGRKTHDK